LLYTFVVIRYKTNDCIEPYAEKAEKMNGRWAMLGIVAGAISYALTGKLFFGVI